MEKSQKIWLSDKQNVANIQNLLRLNKDQKKLGVIIFKELYLYESNFLYRYKDETNKILLDPYYPIFMSVNQSTVLIQ